MIDLKTTTKELAIKITLIVFVFFYVSFLSLIFLHHYKFLYSEKQILLDISNVAKSDAYFLIKALEIRCTWWDNCTTLREMTKDFLVIKWDKIILTRGIYDFMDINKFLNNNLEEWLVYELETEDKDFYVLKVSYDDYDIYFTRDISFHDSYEKSLFLIFLLLSIFLAIFIFLVSYKIAKMSLEPLKTYNESLKLYNHHIAHELKTPLSVLKSDLELLKMWYDEDTLKSSLEEVDNMRSVIDSMLFLSENVILKEKEKIDLLEIVEELEDFYNSKSDKKFIIKSKIKKWLIINWDKHLIKTMIKNLFENAIKYSNSDNIIVNLTKDSIEISNTFDFDIKSEQKSKLFEAFYKLNFDTNSFWLWLSIVKKIVELHSFKIDLEILDKVFKIKIEF